MFYILSYQRDPVSTLNGSLVTLVLAIAHLILIPSPSNFKSPHPPHRHIHIYIYIHIITLYHHGNIQNEGGGGVCISMGMR